MGDSTNWLKGALRLIGTLTFAYVNKRTIKMLTARLMYGKLAQNVNNNFHVHVIVMVTIISLPEQAQKFLTLT